jgi:hypothetical protein
MLAAAAGKSLKRISLKCTERFFPAFPNLLFGNAVDGGRSYFDATLYLQTTNSSLSVDDFINQYQPLLQAIISEYGISPEDAYVRNDEEHILIDAAFTYFFIGFTDSGFLAHLNDRLHDLFTDGFCISDTYLLKAAYSRIPGVVDIYQQDGGLR